jgi:hypothetical protein
MGSTSVLYSSFSVCVFWENAFRTLFGKIVEKENWLVISRLKEEVSIALALKEEVEHPFMSTYDVLGIV